MDLARDHAGKQYFAIVVDLAGEDQISRITRAMGAGRVDQLVHEAAQSLRAALGAERSAYQVGIAQFAFISPAGVEQSGYVELLRSGFETMRASSSVRFVTNVTIGVRSFVAGEVSVDDIIRGATSAAQDARSTEGSIALYSPARDTAHRRQYGLLQDFGAALEAGDQLRLVYQPRIELATGDCIGAEALLRWRHPRLGDISPAEFIPIIEQTSLARPTTQWVLGAAMDQLATWHNAGLAITLSANISAANLGEADLIERIEAGLTQRKLPFTCLEIELTESAIMDQPDQALGMLRKFEAAGVCLAIDDFGTGHSSLAYLQRLPAQVVKIDQTFMRNLTEATGADFVLVETMIGLAHKLGYRVVAEGIETGEAAAILKELGCEEAQGFWFARPMEADQFVMWLSDRRADTLSLPRAA
jgi:EAL domain-containing protein (putative c-di-GMP-specific phosphodiesterase class I)